MSKGRDGTPLTAGDLRAQAEKIESELDWPRKHPIYDRHPAFRDFQRGRAAALREIAERLAR